jgi:hypothetical protein
MSTDDEREYIECAACRLREATRKCVGKESQRIKPEIQSFGSSQRVTVHCSRPLCNECADMANLCPSCRVAAGLPDLRQLVLL